MATESQAQTITLGDKDFEKVTRESKVPVVVDFWAEWCGPCRMLSPILDEIASEFGDKIVVAKLNVDHNPDTAARFGIMSIPAVKVFQGGKEVFSAVGVRPKAYWVDEFKKLI